ncbi:MAG: kynureninase [Ilumatobacter sp.]|uniref:kynureninase/PvdN C-terminal domain-containing protein n=1 Tax=Ilumatobacter sp. TaxID=1967498 RepID=UPI003299AED7
MTDRTDDDVAMITRADAEACDATDPLAHWRDEFVIPDDHLAYLDGNSLGRTPKRAVDALRHVVEQQWAGDLIASWWEHGWLDLPLRAGDTLAPLIGALPGEIAVHDSTTVCLFQLVNVAIDLHRTRDGDVGRPIVVAVEATEFPTDRYVIDGISVLRSPGDVPVVVVRHGLDDLQGVDVVVRSLVDYRTARLAAIVEETRRANDAGAITVWDLSHAAGVVAVDLEGAGVELAAGCTYKFLNGGPGAPAFTYVRRSVQDDVVQPIWGWFAQRDQFAMDRAFDPRDGVGRMLNGTPGILGLTAAVAGISLAADVGIDAIAGKAARLSDFALDVAGELGLTCSTLRTPASSGGHVSIHHDDATELQRRLASERVIVDKRDPDVLRFGLSPLTTRFVDVHRGLTTLADLIA